MINQAYDYKQGSSLYRIKKKQNKRNVTDSTTQEVHVT